MKEAERGGGEAKRRRGGEAERGEGERRVRRTNILGEV